MNAPIRQHGFTLLEIIVALGIFSIVALLSAGILVSFNRVQKRTVAIQNAQDNIRFALETVARSIRTGDNYCARALSPGFQCANGGVASVCSWSSGGCDTFDFREAGTNNKITYRLNGGAVEKSINGGIFTVITDPRVTVSKLKFYVTGITSQFPYALSSIEQQKVTIIMEVQGKAGHQVSQLNLQTTVSKRKLY